MLWQLKKAFRSNFFKSHQLPSSQRTHLPLGMEVLEDRVMLSGFSKAFSPDTIGPGSVSTLTFNISNFESPTPVSDLAFSDTLPAGVTIATPANATSSCDGTVTAPDGGTTITFSNGKVGADSNCSVSVNVTSSTPGVHTNISGDLTGSDGNSGYATDDLTVSTSRPGFTKSFSPSTVNLGSRAELTFTIDNTANGSRVAFLDFVDNLPVGLVVANPANASTDCVSAGSPNTTLTAVPGTGTITLDANGADFMGFEVLSAGATCTVTVDVVATGVGSLGNTTGELLATIGATQVSAGKAAAVLDVTNEDIHAQKEFLADPVPPGGTVDVKFTITNFNRDFPATGIAFTDDLDATLTGLVAVAPLPDPACGGTLTGTDTLSLSGATVAAGDSCMFTVTLQVPPGTPSGAYTNLTGAITATIDGIGVAGASAQDVLFINTAPTLTKAFTDDPVGAGGTVNLEFTITNTDPDNPATDIAFTDELTTFLPEPLSLTLPAGGFCGGSSMIGVVTVGVGGQAISVSGASLPAGGSCSFDVVIDIPVGFPGGAYTNTTGQITATVNLESVTGGTATDDLIVVAAPTLTKQFLDDPSIQPGDTVTLEFTLSHDEFAAGDATAITFTDDLAAVIPGLTVTLPPAPDPPCGAGSSLTASLADTLLTFAGGTLMPGETCTFSVTLNVPAGATPGGHTNTTSNVSAMVVGVTTVENPATDDLDIAGLKLTKEFIDDPAVPGGTTTLRFTIENITTASDATSIFFTDNLTNALSGLSAPGPLSTGTCDGSLTGTTTLTYSGGSLMAGTSCSFDVTLDVPGAAAGDTYVNTTSNFSGDFGSGAALFANGSDSLVVVEEKTSILKQFTDDPIGAGGTGTLEFTITNESPVNAASNIAFSDNLDAALTGLVATGALVNDCGGMANAFPTGMFDYSGGSLAAGASCTIALTVEVPGNSAGGSYVNTTSSITADINGNATTGDAASDTLQVLPSVTLSVSPATIAEAGGVSTVTATLSGVFTQTVSVNLIFTGAATNTIDYVRSDTQIVINPGDETGSITLTAQEDALVEGNERIVVDINGVTNGAELGVQRKLVTIDDNDTARLSIEGYNTVTEEGGTQSVSVTLSTSDGNGGTATLAPGITLKAEAVDRGTGTAVSDTDYDAIGMQMISFAPGSGNGDQQTFDVTPINDDLVEGNETIRLGLQKLNTRLNGQVKWGKARTTTTINDNDTATVSIEPITNVSEDGGAQPIFVTLNTSNGNGGTATLAPGITLSALVVDLGTGTAESGFDYEVFGTPSFSFDPGSGDGDLTSVDFTPKVDGLEEGIETVRLRLRELNTRLDGSAEFGNVHNTTRIDDTI